MPRMESFGCETGVGCTTHSIGIFDDDNFVLETRSTARLTSLVFLKNGSGKKGKRQASRITHTAHA